MWRKPDVLRYQSLTLQLFLKRKKEKINPECTVKIDYIFHTISLLFNPDHEHREPEVCSIVHQFLEIGWASFVCSNTDIF